MAKHIVKYKTLDGNTPDFIEDGGYFSQDKDWMYGLSVDDLYTAIPDGVIKIKRSDLKDTLKDMIITKIVEVELTSQEKNDMVDEFFNKFNVEGV